MHQSSRSRGRAEKPDRCGERGAGRQTKASKIAYDSSCYDGSSIEENFFVDDFNKSLSKRTEGSPIKGRIDKDVSKVMENKHSLPGLIARLMGLDTAPPQMVTKQEKIVGSCLHATSSVGYLGNCMSPQHHFRRKSNEDEEFKDVFEVMETPKVKRHKKQIARKEILNSSIGEVDPYIKQKFMDAKYLSTNEAFQNPEEFDVKMEILDSNSDLLLELLQHPNSSFRKHVHDFKTGIPTSKPCQITILKSSKGGKSERNGGWTKPETSPESSSHLQKLIQHFENPAKNITNHSFEELRQSFQDKTSTSHYSGKNETHVNSTRIVVLKPNLHRAKKMEGDFSLAHENCHFDSQKNREIAVSEIQELHMKERERQKLSDDMEYFGYRAKSSREIAREVTRQMRRKVSTHSKNAFTSDMDLCNKNARPCVMTEFDRRCHIVDHLDQWLNGFSPSLCSTESSMNREARRRLSERWKRTHHFKEAGLEARGSSTLGEMLALPNGGSLSTSVKYFGNKKVTNGKFARVEELVSSDCPLGINNKDVWKDGSCKTLHRSRSLSSVSTNQSSDLSNKKQDSQCNNCHMLEDVLNMNESHNSNSRGSSELLTRSKYGTNRRRQKQIVGENNILLKRVVDVNSEGPRRNSSIHVRCLSQENPVLPDLIIDDGEDLLDSVSYPIWIDKPHLSTSHEEEEEEEEEKQLMFQMPTEVEDSCATDQQLFAAEEPSTQQPVDPIQSEPQAEGLVNSKEVERPSPVSVLEAPSEEESSGSGCFERISADLQELRMQLKLLKLESGGTYEEQIDAAVSSNEESDVDSHSVLSTADTLQSFRNEDDRDFSYLIDMLIESGIHDSKHEQLSDCCYSTNYPVGPYVFDKLEKKYGQIVLWSRSERKLLFDLINGILVGEIVPCMDLRPWVISRRLVSAWDLEGPVEVLSQLLMKQKKYLRDNPENDVLEAKWLSSEDDIEEIGKELEKILIDDLVGELVSELMIS